MPKMFIIVRPGLMVSTAIVPPTPKHTSHALPPWSCSLQEYNVVAKRRQCGHSKRLLPIIPSRRCLDDSNRHATVTASLMMHDLVSTYTNY